MRPLIGTNIAQVRLLKNEEARIRAGHLWVFSNEIDQVEAAEGALLADCFAASGQFLGSAFYSPHSLISCRILDAVQRAGELSRRWIEDRIASAVELRQKIFPSENCVRWVFGESDSLPGIVIDRFDDAAVIQTYVSAGDALLPVLSEVLTEKFGMKTVIERNESPLRRHEELENRRSVLYGAQPGRREIKELGIRYLIDIWGGQKTGFFLDQKLNRWLARQVSSGAEVLDCYSNVGGFSLNALCGNAAHALAVDVSPAALELARLSAEMNGWQGKVEMVEADVFEFLKQTQREKRQFDVVILDPPSFTRNRKAVPVARKAYVKLNTLGISVLCKGGLLLTASCSHHITEETFEEAVQEAARKAGRHIQQLTLLVQSPDHPVLPAMPETRYLKGGIYRVM